MAHRIIYNTQTIDILVAGDGLSRPLFQERSQSRSGSGKIETIAQYGIQELEIKARFNSDVYRQLFGWWSWARQGKVFSFNLDSDNTGNTTLDGDAAAGQKVIPLTDMTSFVTDDICLIRAEDNDDEYEIVEVASTVLGVSVTAKDNLVHSYASGDTFRHWRYWPQLVSLDKEFNPKLIPGTDYYEHVFTFAEKL